MRVRPEDPDSAGVPVATLVAASFALGIALDAALGVGAPTTWLLAATLPLAIGLRRGGRGGGRAALLVATLALGAARQGLDARRAAVEDLAARIGESPRPLHLVGWVAAGPRRLVPPAGVPGLEDLVPAWSLELDVEGVHDETGRLRPAQGRIALRVENGPSAAGPGARVAVRARVDRPPPAAMPGAWDRRRSAMRRGVPLRGRTPDPALVVVLDPATGAAGRLAALRGVARELLLQDLPAPGSRSREALLLALLLGVREPALAPVAVAFRDAGLAHLLAVSGLHLGLLLGALALALRGVVPARRWRGLLLVAAALAFALVVEARVPVLRASAMASCAALGAALGRRWRLDGLLGLGAILLLAWRPADLFAPGFQLSFGIVLALVHLTRRRDPDAALVATPRDDSPAGLLRAALRRGLRSAVVAWAVSAPLVARHFGLATPLAPLLAPLALPPVALLLVVGFLKILLAPIVPHTGPALGVLLALLADGIAAAVAAIARLPLSGIAVAPPSLAWTVLATAAVVALLRFGLPRRRAGRSAAAALAAALLFGLIAPTIARRDHGALRLDVLPVGDGTCILVRSGRAALLVDAGSASDPLAGRRTIVPALRALGVARLDAVALSHANLDHYGAVGAVIEAIPTRALLVTPPTLRAARRAPGGPLAALLAEAPRRGTRVAIRSAGGAFAFGTARARWLHPGAEGPEGPANDASAVVRIEAAGRRVLLTGDLESAGIERVLAHLGGATLRADVLELPHHGAWSEAALDLVACVDPALLLQSTGPARLRGDPWPARLENRPRLVTARDGWIRVRIDDAGTLRWESDDGRGGAGIRGAAPQRTTIR